MFINAARTLRVHCVEGITATRDPPALCELQHRHRHGPQPGDRYDKSTELAAEAMKTGRGIMELIREKKILTEEQIAKVLDPGRHDRPGRSS